MKELTPQQKLLSEQMLAEQIPAARMSAEHLGLAAGPVLERLAKHEKSNVRLLVLELAPLATSVESSRSIIALLSDSNPTVRAVAVGDLAVCFQKEVVPDLLQVLKQRPDSDVTSAVIRQIGIAGDRTYIPALRRYRSDPEPGIAHQASIAMARLGDETERDKIVASLASMDSHLRVQALRDCQYVADKNLARYFGPLIDDFHDFMVVTPPHIEPVVVARVCDIVVQTMAYMGFPFSFQAQFLARRSAEELAEAKALIAELNRIQ